MLQREARPNLVRPTAVMADWKERRLTSVPLVRSRRLVTPYSRLSEPATEPEMGIDLPVIWAIILAFTLMMYVVMHGFHLGIGILFPFLPDMADRATTSQPRR